MRVHSFSVVLSPPCHWLAQAASTQTQTHYPDTPSAILSDPACALSVSLSLHFNGHIPGGSGLAGTRMSPLWILLKLRVTEV